MQVNSVSSNAANTSTGSTTDTSANPASTLSQANFLQLLVAQLQNQDPMDPQSDTDMAAQMAQFSSLQESTNMSGSLSMMQANSLVGSTVNLQIDSNTTASGVVQGVVMTNGSPEILVNGTTYPMSQITSVEPPSASSSGNVATNGNTQN
jgi:flagellar basal-body rod modification protein FlgD